MRFSLDWYNYVFICLAALAAGFVNALAGGGTLISFPVLTAVGIPPVIANVTNTVALVPGYLGATIAQMKAILEQRARVNFYVPAAVVGGVIGGYLLLNTGERLFSELVPYLILLASILLAIGEPVRAWLVRRGGQGRSETSMIAIGVIPITLAAVYGGYFGAGLSVIFLAVLGLILNDSITRLNALKQILSFSTNLAAAIFFVFSGKVLWPVALLMAVFALTGGALGGRMAGKIKPAVLRWVVVGIGLVVSFIYFIR